jgi:3',5'-cyclic AMP phosphodiesterase CpdA
MRLIHLSDPHLSSLSQHSFASLRGKRRSGYLSWYRRRRHVHRREILDRLTQSALAESADHFLVTGDLVHIGLEDEMARAKEWLATLGPPSRVTLVPGNHDIYAPDSQAAMIRQWGAYLPASEKRDIDPVAGFPFSRDYADVRLIGLNSACVTRIFSAEGQLGAEQLARLPEVMLPAPDRNKPTCLLIHHPPLPGLTSARKALRDATALEASLKELQPDLVLYGHLHRNRALQLGRTRVFGTASASYTGTASYRIFDVNRAGGRWELKMRLKSISQGHSSAMNSLPVISEQCWEI